MPAQYGFSPLGAVVHMSHLAHWAFYTFKRMTPKSSAFRPQSRVTGSFLIVATVCPPHCVVISLLSRLKRVGPFFEGSPNADHSRPAYFKGHVASGKPRTVPATNLKAGICPVHNKCRHRRFANSLQPHCRHREIEHVLWISAEIRQSNKSEDA